MKKLFDEGKIIGVITCDSDMLCYGITNLISEYNPYNRTCIIYHIPTIPKELELTKEQFIDLGVVSGNDYLNNIYGLGIVKNYNLIKKYGSIEMFPEDKKPKGYQRVEIYSRDRFEKIPLYQ